MIEAFDQKYLNEEVAEFPDSGADDGKCLPRNLSPLQSFPAARLERVRIEETSKNSFEYSETDTECLP